jgi:hypothetical protein
MTPVPSNHDPGAKIILGGRTLPAGQSADQDLRDALDTIFQHPNVGPFIGKQLIQHLVTANPSPDYVARVSAAFANDGHGVRGNLGAVVRAILLDPEARGDLKSDPRYGKVKEPVLFLTGLARALGVTSDGVYFVGAATAMEQPVYAAPSVFNFYPPNYALSSGLLSPASVLLDTGSVFTRDNVVRKLLYLPPGPDPTVSGATGTQVPSGDFLPLGNDPTALVDQLNALMMHGTLAPDIRSAIRQALSVRAPGDTGGRVQTAVYLVATSPHYQVER